MAGILKKLFQRTTEERAGITKTVPRKYDLIPVSDVMSKPVKTIDASASVKEAADAMKKANIRGLVVTENGAVRGIVTDRDIVERLVALGRSSEKTKISSIMTAKPKLIVARPDEDLISVTKRMRTSGIGRIPVVTRAGDLVGIVTETDLTRIYPGLVEVLYEELEVKGSPFAPDRETMAGRCDRCTNYSEFLVQFGDEWLCDVCGADITAERAMS